LNTRDLPRLRAALAFASMGWPVLGLSPGTNIPLKGCNLCYRDSPDYVPHHGVDECPHSPDYCHGFHSATLDPDRIHSLWARFPDANVGISTGPAHLVVVDCDTNKDGKEPKAPYNLPGVVDGSDVFAMALEKYKVRFPGDTLFVATPRGGWHFYWELPPDLVVNKSEGKFGWLIDVRSTGSYITAPTSVRPDGVYKRLGDVLQPKPAPDWLLHHLRGTGHMPEPRKPFPVQRNRRFQDRPIGQRGKSLQDLATELEGATEGERHTVLCRVTTAAAYLVERGQCTQSDMESEMYAAGRVAGRSDGEIRDAVQTAFTYVGHRGVA
jgi:hypothetical protein